MVVASNIRFERALFYSYKRCLPPDAEFPIKMLSLYLYTSGIDGVESPAVHNNYLANHGRLINLKWGDVARMRTYNSEEGSSSNWAQFRSEDEENGSYCMKD